MPVAPEFEDPPRAPNYAPSFAFSDPFFETTNTAPVMFAVRVTDPNPEDSLYVRWVSDYPPYVQGRSRIVLTEKRSPPAELVYATGMDDPMKPCVDFATGTGDRKLVVIVSDRPFFSPPEMAPNMAFRFNAVEGDPKFTFQPLMAGWTISGCP